VWGVRVRSRRAERHRRDSKSSHATPRRCACARAVASSTGETPAPRVRFAGLDKSITDQLFAADAARPTTENMGNVRWQRNMRAKVGARGRGACARGAVPPTATRRGAHLIAPAARGDRPFSWVEERKDAEAATAKPHQRNHHAADLRGSKVSVCPGSPYVPTLFLCTRHDLAACK
jgi:hypothetical protein